MDLDAEFPDLRPEDADLLRRVAANMPILADLSRSDLVLYLGQDGGDSAVAAFHAQPHSVSAAHPASLVGRRVTRVDEPLVLAALRDDFGGPLHARDIAPGRPTIQDLHPVRGSGGSVVAALGIETNVVEYARHRRRSIIFRRAIAQLQQMGLHGEIAGASTLTPFGEHDGIVVVDAAGRIRYVSGVAENLHRKLGFTDKLVKSSIAEMTGHELIFRRAFETHQCVEMESDEGQLIWIRKALPILVASRRPFRAAHSNDRRLSGVLITIHDATDARRKEQELRIKAAMIQEIHHRVKNNLQTIAALLRLQSRRVAGDQAQVALQESVSRILAVAVVHEFLSHDEAAVISIRDVGARILEQTKEGILDPAKGITLTLSGDNLALPAQRATACALVINELVQNAVEHGYAHRRGGSISLGLRDEGDDMVIEVADDGEGLPAGFDLHQTGSLGLKIVQTLVREDLKGAFNLHGGRGVRATVRFPKTA